jgi:hydroxymethylbilane synthase
MKLTIGTRGSALALWQARHVATAIEAAHPEISVDLTIIKTTGDKILDTPLALIGGKGLFTKEIEEALLDGRVDLAVHSMKDLPTELPDGLKLGAVLKREDARDVFVSRDDRLLANVGPGDKIGTSSLRRKAFVLTRFPDMQLVDIRGNVDTRLKKIHTEKLGGILLAAAGVKRLGFSDRISQYISIDTIIPAIGQGAMGVEIRRQDPEVDDVVRSLNHPDTAVCVAIERAFLHRMGGGCQVPLAAHATINDKKINVSAAVVHPSGSRIMRENVEVEMTNTTVGVELADRLIAKGADSILKSVLGTDWEPGLTELIQSS